MWHHINEEKDDNSFIGVEKVSWDETLLHCFLKSRCFENSDMKSPLRLA
jgi:hypothetical protein